MRIELFEAVRALQLRLHELGRALQAESDRAGWLYGVGTGAAAREEAARAYRAIQHEDSQLPQETHQAYGVIAASPSGAHIAREVNGAKDRMRSAVESLRLWFVSQQSPESGRAKDLALRQALGLVNVPRFHYRQAKRHIKILPRCPLQFGFTWLRTRDVHCITKADAQRRLGELLGLHGVAAEMRRLGAVAEREKLVVVNLTRPKARMNILWERGVEGGKPKRQAILATMPILIPMEPGESLPETLTAAQLRGDGGGEGAAP